MQNVKKLCKMPDFLKFNEFYCIFNEKRKKALVDGFWELLTDDQNIKGMKTLWIGAIPNIQLYIKPNSVPRPARSILNVGVSTSIRECPGISVTLKTSRA